MTGATIAAFLIRSRSSTLLFTPYQLQSTLECVSDLLGHLNRRKVSLQRGEHEPANITALCLICPLLDYEKSVQNSARLGCSGTDREFILRLNDTLRITESRTTVPIEILKSVPQPQ